MPAVEDGQRRAGQHAHRHVGKTELDLDRLDQRRDDEPVGDVHRVDEEHQEQHPPTVRRQRLRRRLLSICRDCRFVQHLSPHRLYGVFYLKMHDT
jgi:hypothetical protein